MDSVLSCFFPTTVVLVDDNADFLESLTETIESAGLFCKAFTDPKQALEYINEVSRINKLDYSDLIRDGEENTSDWTSILFNISGLHREIYSSNRFMRISAVISDYMMPLQMSGVELCSNIHDKGIQRILLTGVADNTKGVEAFNEGYITRFVKKGTPSFESDFLQNLEKSIFQYFKYYTNFVAKHISIVDSTHLNDNIFTDFFFKIYSNGTYVESYMLDAFGSYLLLKADGKASMLSVLTESELDRLIDVGIASEEIDPDVLAKLRSRKYMIVFHSRLGTLPPITKWGEYIHPAIKVDGYRTYYCALSVAEPDLDYDKIISFNSFKKSLAR